MPDESLLAFSEIFYQNSDKLIQWNAFLRKNKLGTSEMTLELIIIKIKEFLMEPLQSILLKTSFSKIWNTENKWV